MKVIGRIKPEAMSLFPAYAGASIAIDISLNPPIFSPNVTQELKINLIVVFLEHIAIGHLCNQRTSKLLITLKFTKLLSRSISNQAEPNM